MEQTQRIKISTKDGSSFRTNIKIDPERFHTNPELTIKNEMVTKGFIETEQGFVATKDIKEIKFVEDNDGIIGF
ncbi:MAG: hypothetical protein ABC378_08870 [Staphylococcus pseudoxylosus]|uniref:hypothetical protein n=1 Tax=Staphylococcus pseudoxylosus TaxID=2282419 RepID=UPI0031F6EA71